MELPESQQGNNQTGSQAESKKESEASALDSVQAKSTVSNATTEGAPVVPQKTPNKQKAIQLKVKGNQSWKAGDMEAAVRYYSEAIEYDSTSAELFRNRSAACAVVKDWNRAIDDANIAIGLDNSAKSHCRKAEAYFNWGIQQRDPDLLDQSVRCFEDAYRIEAVQEIKGAVEQTAYYLTWMRAEKALQLSKADNTHPKREPKVKV